MVPSSTLEAAFEPLFIVHPITRETWDIAPLLRVMYVLNATDPNGMAEVFFDIARYISAEQHSAQDTAARLRLMLARLDHLGTAFDSISVGPAVAMSPMMRAV